MYIYVNIIIIIINYSMTDLQIKPYLNLMQEQLCL